MNTECLFRGPSVSEEESRYEDGEAGSRAVSLAGGLSVFLSACLSVSLTREVVRSSVCQ